MQTTGAGIGRRLFRARSLTAAVTGFLAGSLALAGCGGSSDSGGSGGSGGGGGTVGVSLILKTLTNPYFVSMENDAKAEAKKQNVNLTVAGGKQDGDTATQISAIDNAISRGDKAILITTNGDAVNSALQRAKKAGIYIVALDTVLTPATTADITYATDNEKAGKLIGQYAATKLDGQKATIAMLDLNNQQVISVDIQRDHGFLEGMGIDPGSKTQNGQEAKTGKYTAGKGGDYQVVCHQPTTGAIPGGKTAMENCLSANGDINVVYTINEPSADGALQALKAAGKTNVIVATIDGSCKYVKGLVKDGTIAGDSAQYPGKMATLGVQAAAQAAKGNKQKTPAGQEFIDSGTALVTANAISGVTAQTPDQAAAACWGS
jgi:fructose transport system substrate-binding protein